jgi:hypothetical protein
MQGDNWSRPERKWAGWLAVFLLVGCAPTKVDTTGEYTGKEPLARPNRVLVYDFAVSPDDVSLNSAIGTKLANLVKGSPKNEEQLKVGRAVAKALSEGLVKEIQDLGLPAERATVVEPLVSKTLAIEGQFLSINEGNRLRRMVIGFGVGGTEVKTQVQVSLGTDSGRQLVQEFETAAQSSKKPGMGPMVGVGAAASTAGTAAAVSGGVGVATEFNQTVEGDAKRTAKEVAKTLSRFFFSQGWIPKEKVIQ